MDNNNRQNQANINWYPGHMAKAKKQIAQKINLIDIVFEVIDARMPYSSKIRDINKYIKNKPKILIITKIDLCDLNETKKWISYYKKEGYITLFLNLEKNVNITNKIINVVDEVMKDNFAKREKKGLIKRKTRVLVVGSPNVGKSTLINRLSHKKVAHTGNKPGITKSLDWIRVNQELELLDTPGILWPKIEEEKVALNLASFSAIKEEILPLETVCIYILNSLLKYYPSIAKSRYGIISMDMDIFPTLDIIGKKRGCLLRGGMTDYDKVYHLVLNDIKNGNIKGITLDRVGDYQ